MKTKWLILLRSSVDRTSEATGNLDHTSDATATPARANAMMRLLGGKPRANSFLNQALLVLMPAAHGLNGGRFGLHRSVDRQRSLAHRRLAASAAIGQAQAIPEQKRHHEGHDAHHDGD